MLWRDGLGCDGAGRPGGGAQRRLDLVEDLSFDLAVAPGTDPLFTLVNPGWSRAVDGRLRGAIVAALAGEAGALRRLEALDPDAGLDEDEAVFGLEAQLGHLSL